MGHPLPFGRRDDFFDPAKLTEVEKLRTQCPDGAYLFVPKWDDPLPKLYSQANKDIKYVRGNHLE